jgi:hypothetical protein
MQHHNYMPLAARGHLANMNILHDDFRFFGDNHLNDTMVFATATRARSDSGSGGDARIKAFLHAGADLLTHRVFGTDFDGCRTLGRYLIATASAHLSIPFVFSPTPPDLSASKNRRLKTNLAPSLCPQEGRGRSFSPRIAQDEFPAHISAGVCR